MPALDITGEFRNKRWTDDEFLERRKKVLARWPTGQEIDLDEAVAYHKKLPPEQSHVIAYAKALREGHIVLSVQLGSATVEETAEHIRHVAAAGAGAVLINTDSYNRKSRYDLAQRLLEQSVKERRSLLNGFPIVNHGVKGSRRLVESVNIPLQLTNHSDEEPELQAEITYAGGMTAGYCDSVRELVTHCKDCPLEQRIIVDQYLCKLAAYYTERGAPIQMETPASLLGLCPPGLGGALQVFEALLAAEQGVKYFDFAYDARGNLLQDVAAIRGTKELMLDYLGRFGYHDVKLRARSYAWVGEWPRDEMQAAALIAWFTVIGALAKADAIQSRSIEEAIGIPTKEANAKTLRVMRQVLENNCLAQQGLPDSPELREEEEMFKLEVRALVEAVLDLGHGDLAVGMVRATQTGALDFPFSCWVHLRNKVMSVRDAAGAVRYLDAGNLPVPKQVIEFHRRKIEQRERAENRPADIEMVIGDLRHMARPLLAE